MCLDANTGKVLWEHKFNVWFTDIVKVRLGWTCLVGDPETGNVYAHGTQGLLSASTRTARFVVALVDRGVWPHFRLRRPVTSPIIDENLLIIGMVNASWGQYATGGNRFMAFDKKNGTVVWTSSSVGRPKDTYYSVPVVAVINGERLLISGGADGGVHALRARTGEIVWSYSFGSGAVNCSPVVAGNYIYIGHGEDNPDNNKQGRVICLDGAR